MPTITVGQTLTGTITNAYDQINYDVALTANTTYTIRMVGAGTSTYTLVDPLIDGIYNSTGSTYISGFNNDGLLSGPNGRDAMSSFRPGTSGTYRVIVSGDLGTTGTYAFSVINSSGGTDNIAATTATTGTVAVGGSVTGTIDTENDVDWYRVALNGGTTYTIRMRGLVSGNGTLPDPVIAGIYNSSGVFIANTYVDDLNTRDAGVTFVTPYTGNYYIAARGWSNYTGTFALDVAATGTDVPGNLTSTATLAIGSSVTTKMEQPYDHDWYGVTLTAGRTYQFSLSGTGTDNTPVMHGIFNSAGTYMGGYAAPILGPLSASSTSIFTPTVSGTYYIDAFSLYEGTYTLTATQVADDVPATTSSTATVAVNSSVTGDIGGATDIDMHAVNLVAGTTYVIKLQGKQSNKGTLEDPIIAGVYDSSGMVIANTFSDDSDGNEASLIFRPTTSGTYYIGADGYAGYTGTYTLSVTSIAGDVGHTVATAGSVALNTPTVVTIDDASDIDWYGVTLTAGTTYGIRTNGAPTKRGTLQDPVILGVYNGAGALISDTFVDDSGSVLNAKLSFTPSSTGTYYVALDGYDRFTGTMKFAVTNDNIGTTNATSGSLTVGTPTEGVIDFVNDVDHYGVALTGGATYYIRMQGLHGKNGDLVDPHISAIQNSGGTAQTITTITETTLIGLDAWVKFTPGSTATYYLVTSGGSGEGDFLLTASLDTGGSQTSTATVAVGGSVSDMIDEGTDSDWYRVSLNANTSYVIKMLGVDNGSGTLSDPSLEGLRRIGTPTTIITGTSVNDTAGLGRDAVVRYVPTATDTYFIAAGGNGTTAVGSYILSVALDAGQTAATAWTTLALGGSASGEIDDGADQDWYKVSLNTNTSYIFKMLGTDSSNGTLDDPMLAIHNSSGTATTTNRVLSAVGMDAVMRFYTTTAGDFYINAQSAGSDIGTFLLTAETEPGPTNGTAHGVSLGVPIVGAIDDASDVDRFSISLNAGTQYRIRLEGANSGKGTLTDPYINGIRNAAGTVQTGTTQDGGGTGSDVMFSFTPAATGVYYIDADNGAANTTIVGTYTLTVSLWA